MAKNKINRSFKKYCNFIKK